MLILVHNPSCLYFIIPDGVFKLPREVGAFWCWTNQKKNDFFRLYGIRSFTNCYWRQNGFSLLLSHWHFFNTVFVAWGEVLTGCLLGCPLCFTLQENNPNALDTDVLCSKWRMDTKTYLVLSERLVTCHVFFHVWDG